MFTHLDLELPPERVENFAAHLSWKSNYCIFFFFYCCC